MPDQKTLFDRFNYKWSSNNTSHLLHVGFVHAIEDINLMTSAMRKVGIRGKLAVGAFCDRH